MLRKAGRIGAALAALAAIAVGSAAAAGAASQNNSAGASSPAAPAHGQPPGDGGGRRAHKPETPLSGTIAEKVKAAALAKVDGGTIIRVETDSDHGSPYEAHVRKPDGTEAEVLVNKQFEVTAVNSFGRRG